MSNYKSPVLAPAEIPRIALDSMNDTHHEEVELINQLGLLLEQALNGSTDEDAISKKLREWVEHTRQHFDGENKLMQEYGFPAYSVHSGEHQQVLAQIEALQQQWLDNKAVQPLADFIFVNWLNWFTMHVNSMDMVTAQFLSQRVA